MVTALVLLLFPFLMTETAFSQGQDTDGGLEKYNEVEEEVELSPGMDICPCKSEESKQYDNCRHYELISMGADPLFFYYVDEILHNYKKTIKVWLVNAVSGEIVKIGKENEKSSKKQSWKSEVDPCNFRVVENWNFWPIEIHHVYRLRWEINKQYFYSEAFEIEIKHSE